MWDSRAVTNYPEMKPCPLVREQRCCGVSQLYDSIAIMKIPPFWLATGGVLICIMTAISQLGNMQIPALWLVPALSTPNAFARNQHRGWSTLSEDSSLSTMFLLNFTLRLAFSISRPEEHVCARTCIWVWAGGRESPKLPFTSQCPKCSAFWPLEIGKALFFGEGVNGAKKKIRGWREVRDMESGGGEKGERSF